MTMTRILTISITGKFILGLVLAVSLFVAVPIKADVVRGTDALTYTLDPIFEFKFDGIDTWTAPKGVGAGWEFFKDGVDVPDWWHSAVNTGNFEAVLETWTTKAGHGYSDFAASFNGNISSLTINGTSVTDLLEGTDNWFYDFGWLRDDIGEYLQFNFSGTGPFIFTFYGMTSTDPVPEPATLAVLGLGLAGLGLARRRVK